ncbi:MAG: PorV/PorQ family protein [Candidatus Marinimicrobia bacterium]|nr:PorV/PorQ family protein [Candidatus Neomarinimicrobiota bacterium]
MKFKKLVYGIFISVFLISTSIFAKDYEKLAQTGFQFLSVNTYARGTAMGGAMTTVMDIGSGALFFNPAGLALSENRADVSLSQNNWIADIKHNSLSASFKPLGGQLGVIGISAISVDYGKMQGTMTWNNDKGYIDTEILQPSALSFGLGYAKELSTKFSVGGQVKYAGQNLGQSVVEVEKTDSLGVAKYKEFATAFDFGTLFRTGWESIVFGMSIRNFSNEIRFEDEGFQLPLTFHIGLSMDVLDFVPIHSGTHNLFLSVDAVHPRSYPEYANLGLEYSLNDVFYLRYGYMGNRDERSSSFGLGIEKFGLSFDYSYMPFGVFEETQCFTLNFAL